MACCCLVQQACLCCSVSKLSAAVLARHRAIAVLANQNETQALYNALVVAAEYGE